MGFSFTKLESGDFILFFKAKVGVPNVYPYKLECGDTNVYLLILECDVLHVYISN